MTIREVLPKDNYKLYIVAEDGRSGLFDVSAYLNLEAFEELKNAESFRKVRSGGYFIEWDCGADLCADTIEAEWKLTPQSAG